MYHFLVISMDNENGKKRRSVLNYDYTWIEGLSGRDLDNPIVQDVHKKMFLRYNVDKHSNKFNGYVGNFSSHIKTLQYIVKEKLNNCVLLEDDSILTKENLPDPTTLPQDGMTLFSGRLQKPTWKNLKEWHQNGEPQKIIQTFQQGINLMDYDTFRFTQSNAIFIPNETVAKDVLHHMKTSKYKYKSMDLYYSQHKLVKYLYYPAPFIHDDLLAKVGSNINSLHGVMKDYVLIQPPKSRTNNRHFYPEHLI